MLSKIKKTFLTKSFLTFCIIGGLAYLLHQGIYLLYTKTFGFYDDKNHLISTAIAFTVIFPSLLRLISSVYCVLDVVGSVPSNV